MRPVVRFQERTLAGETDAHGGCVPQEYACGFQYPEIKVEPMWFVATVLETI